MHYLHSTSQHDEPQSTEKKLIIFLFQPFIANGKGKY